MDRNEIIKQHFASIKAAWRELIISCGAIGLFVIPSSHADLIVDAELAAKKLHELDPSKFYERLHQREMESVEKVLKKVHFSQKADLQVDMTRYFIPKPDARSSVSEVRAFFQAGNPGDIVLVNDTFLSKEGQSIRRKAESECRSNFAAVERFNVKKQLATQPLEIVVGGMNVLTSEDAKRKEDCSNANGLACVRFRVTCKGDASAVVDAQFNYMLPVMSVFGELRSWLSDSGVPGGDVDVIMRPLVPFVKEVMDHQLADVDMAMAAVRVEYDSQAWAFLGISINRSRANLICSIVILLMLLHFYAGVQGFIDHATEDADDENWKRLPWVFFSGKTSIISGSLSVMLLPIACLALIGWQLARREQASENAKLLEYGLTWFFLALGLSAAGLCGWGIQKLLAKVRKQQS